MCCVCLYDAFRNLENQISDLADEHFQELPGPVPDEIKRSIPPNIPSLFANTEAARNLRAAYVEHHISSIITRRIFDPFLFVLGSRVLAVDYLFKDWAETMKRKSTKREALWRQRTLHAAYTASSAKQSINKIATHIVDEIVEAIKYFAHHTRWQHMTVAVRRVVKTAAETWRYARLELGLITASMSGEDIARSPDSGPGVSSNNDEDARAHVPKILLTRFPLIKREPVPEDLKTESDTEDKGYIYSRGGLLCADDPDVLACQRGLPGVSSESRQLQDARVTSRTRSRAQKDEPAEVRDEIAEDRAPKKLAQRLDTPSLDNGVARSTTSLVHKDRALYSSVEPFQDDRASASRAESLDDDRATPRPVDQDVEQWHDAERDSKTATPEPNPHDDLGSPKEERPASIRSGASSRQSIRSEMTASSQRRRVSTNQAADIPDWANGRGIARWKAGVPER
ncbi:MAG: hypothetical protein Q9195_006052 [Heterodermia aff. obscurata]